MSKQKSNKPIDLTIIRAHNKLQNLTLGTGLHIVKNRNNPIIKNKNNKNKPLNIDLKDIYSFRPYTLIKNINNNKKIEKEFLLYRPDLEFLDADFLKDETDKDLEAFIEIRFMLGYVFEKSMYIDFPKYEEKLNRFKKHVDILQSLFGVYYNIFILNVIADKYRKFEEV
jgi:hypothetical protein